jgi:hypothetical protein
MHVNRLRENLQKRINELKNISVDKFVVRCVEINERYLNNWKDPDCKKSKEDLKMIERMIQLEFTLAYDDKYTWLDYVLTNG